MQENHNDKLFKQIAKQYAEEFGVELRQELTELERTKTVYVTPNLDRKVREIGKKKKKKYTAFFIALAASILILLITPGILRQNREQTLFPGNNTAPETSQTEAEAPSKTDTEADTNSETLPDTVRPEPTLPDTVGPGATKPEEVMPDSSAKLIPLNAALPRGFEIEKQELDRGKSIYYLSNKEADDVVVTLEEDSGDDWYKSLKQIDLDGTPAYGKSGPDYKMLVVEKGGILYTLTCVHDFNTLVAVGMTIR